MALETKLESEGRLLTLRIDEEIDADDLQEVFEELERYLKGDVNQLLVLRKDANAAYGIETGMLFGERFGELLASAGIVVAVVKGGEQHEDVVIDPIMFSKGVSVGEFDNEEEARAWLLEKGQ